MKKMISHIFFTFRTKQKGSSLFLLLLAIIESVLGAVVGVGIGIGVLVGAVVGAVVGGVVGGVGLVVGVGGVAGGGGVGGILLLLLVVVIVGVILIVAGAVIGAVVVGGAQSLIKRLLINLKNKNLTGIFNPASTFKKYFSFSSYLPSESREEIVGDLIEKKLTMKKEGKSKLEIYITITFHKAHILINFRWLKFSEWLSEKIQINR